MKLSDQTRILIISTLVLLFQNQNALDIEIIPQINSADFPFKSTS